MTEEKGALQQCLDDRFFIAQAWTDEDDADTRKSGVSVWPMFCRPCCARVETRVGNRKYILKKEEVGNIQGGSEIPQAILNAILGHKYR